MKRSALFVTAVLAVAQYAAGETIIQNDFSGVSGNDLIGAGAIPVASHWVNASGHESSAGSTFAGPRGLAATYDHDGDPTTPEKELPGGYEVNGYNDVYGGHTLTITAAYPDHVKDEGQTSLRFWAAFRPNGAVEDTSGAGVRIVNVTKQVDLVPLTAITFASRKTEWQLNRFVFPQRVEYTGDEIQVIFYGGGTDNSSGLALADIRMLTNAQGADAIATPANEQPVILPTIDKPVPRQGPPVADQAEEKDRPRHEQFMREKQYLLKNGPIDLVFVGDSITDGWRAKPQADLFQKTWGKYNPYNIGISGDQTQHVLWRIEHGELDEISPKVLVLMIGTNNIGNGMTPDQTVSGIKAVVGAIREKLPQTDILLLSVFPRGEHPADPARAAILAVNAAISSLDDGGHVRYLDIYDRFLDAQGTLSKEIMPDALHPSERGYEIWADAIGATLDEMMK